MGTPTSYNLLNSFRLTPKDPSDSFVMLDHSIQQSSNKNPSSTSSQKIQGLSHVIQESQKDVTSRLDEHVEQIRSLEKKLEEATTTAAEMIMKNLNLEEEVRKLKLTQSLSNALPVNDKQDYTTLKKQFDELNDQYKAQDNFLYLVIEEKNNYERRVSTIETERNNLLSQSQLLLEKNQRKTQKKEELRNRIQELETQNQTLQTQKIYLESEKQGLKDTNRKLIRHVEKIQTTLIEAGLLAVNPETGKASDASVEIAIFSLIDDHKKLQEIAQSLSRKGFLEEKANYNAIEIKNAFNNFIQKLTQGKEEKVNEIIQLKKILATQRQAFNEINTIANQRIDQVSDLQKQLRALIVSKNKISRALHRLNQTPKSQREKTNWIETLNTILTES